MSDNSIVLRVENLKTYFRLDEGELKAVDGVSLELHKTRTLSIIGESGCGKSVTAQSIMRIVPRPGRIREGRILYTDSKGTETDLASLEEDGKEIRQIRGKEITMIFQEPMTSLSPVHTIGNQIMEAILYHVTHDRREAREIAVSTLAKVGISNGAQRMTEYPHQLSGGLRQRVMIAMALSCGPSILIADEPTTALDVTVQAQILKLMRTLQDQYGMAMLYITHNLGVVARVSHSVAVMYLGKIVEMSPVRVLFHEALHPYTQLLLQSIPTVGKAAGRTLKAIEGTVPLPLGLPERCGFVDRCPVAMRGVCDKREPPLLEVEQNHYVRCFLYGGSGSEEAAVPDDAPAEGLR